MHDCTHDCLGELQDYVYAFRPLEAVTVNISLCESSFDTKLILYEKTINSSDLTLLSCNDDGCDTQSWLQVTHFHYSTFSHFVVESLQGGAQTGHGESEHCMAPASVQSLCSCPASHSTCISVSEPEGDAKHIAAGHAHVTLMADAPPSVRDVVSMHWPEQALKHVRLSCRGR